MANKNDLPNDWTYCSLVVSTFRGEPADTHEIERLKQELVDPDDNSPLSFFNHVEIPECLIENCYKIGKLIEDDNEKECGYRYLHEFTKKEWGTPFDADDVTFTESESDGTLIYNFRVLDGMPIQWLQEVSIEFPHLMFELECENELELFDSFQVTYIDGEEISHDFHKKQP